MLLPDKRAISSVVQFLVFESNHGYDIERLTDLLRDLPTRYHYALLRLRGQLHFRHDNLVQAAADGLAAAEKTDSVSDRAEALTFVGFVRINQSQFHAATDVLARSLDLLSRSRSLRFIFRRRWHYANFFSWVAREKLGEIEEGVPFLLEALRTERRQYRGERFFDLGLAYAQLGAAGKAVTYFEKAALYPQYSADATRWIKALSSKS